ncbi:MAG: hypothetical protein WKF71_14840 [Pyrinomonadaceae bacterium]
MAASASSGKRSVIKSSPRDQMKHLVSAFYHLRADSVPFPFGLPLPDIA